MGPSPAKLLAYMHIRPRWHSGTHSCPSSSLLHNFFPSGPVGPASSLVPLYSGTVGPTPAKLPYMQIRHWWCSGSYSYPRTSLLNNFFPSGTVGPVSSLVFPYWYSGTWILTSSSLVIQWDLALPNFFPTWKFVPGDAVGPIPALVFPYFMISFLVLQWDPPPL